jgi:hypothetical protein
VYSSAHRCSCPSKCANTSKGAKREEAKTVTPIEVDAHISSYYPQESNKSTPLTRRLKRI